MECVVVCTGLVWKGQDEKLAQMDCGGLYDTFKHCSDVKAGRV